MDIAADGLLALGELRGINLQIPVLDVVHHHVPEALQEALRSVDAGCGPLEGELCGGGEHHEEADGVGAVAVNHGLRIDSVVLGLRHLGHAGVHELVSLPGGLGDVAGGVPRDLDVERAYPDAGARVVSVVEGVSEHHALAEQVGERLVALDEAGVAEQLVVEAGIEEVQAGMLDSSDVLINREPVAGLLRIKHAVLVVRAAVAGVVPA